MLPSDMERFRFIEDAFSGACLRWGYREVRTPTLEHLNLFTSAGTLTPSLLNRVYSFLDWDGWSGERVVLRPDGTIPVARLFIENFAGSEIERLFYITNVFVFEESGKENRERWQCGVEHLGNPGATADIEIIMLALEALRSIGLQQVELQLSHAGMLKAIIKDLKLETDREAALLNQVRDGNWKALADIKTQSQTVNSLISLLFDLKGKSSGYLQNLKSLPDISASLRNKLDNFIEITALLDAMECKYDIDVTFTPGFEYYTGLCFQFLLNGQKVGGGGRYNDLVPLTGGDDTPACGFALYVDRLMGLVKPKIGEDAARGIQVRGLSTSPDVTAKCLELSTALHKLGYLAELDFSSRQAEWRWLVEVGDSLPGYTVKDRNTGEMSTAESASSVVNIIGGSL